MLDFYMTVRSITWGQKGRDALTRAGLNCHLQRAPRVIAPEGCAYALSLPRREGSRGKQILDRANIRVTGCYLRHQDGSFERLEP